MVVRLHLEHDRQAFADVDRAGVFAGTLQHTRTARRQVPQQLARVLVAAMLAPHRAEHPKLDQVRLATEVTDDLFVFGGEKAEGAERSRVRAFARSRVRANTERANDSNRGSPSVLPSSASEARSGCGISPNTLPRPLAIP